MAFGTKVLMRQRQAELRRDRVEEVSGREKEREVIESDSAPIRSAESDRIEIRRHCIGEQHR